MTETPNPSVLTPRSFSNIVLVFAVVLVVVVLLYRPATNVNVANVGATNTRVLVPKVDNRNRATSTRDHQDTPYAGRRMENIGANAHSAIIDHETGVIDMLPLSSNMSMLPVDYKPFNATESWNTSARLLVSNNFQGRLGNLMFIYASLYGLARRHGRNALAVVPATFPLFDYFTLTVRETTVMPTAKLVVVGDGGRCCRASPNLLHMAQRDTDVRLGGYLQSYRYFDAYWYDVIRTEFKFRADINAECVERVRSVMSTAASSRTQNTTYSTRTLDRSSLNARELRIVERKGCLMIGVHARRGDFTLAGKKRFGHMPANAQYVHTAMDWFRRRYASHACTRFLVASDDSTWTRQEFGDMSDVHIVPTHAKAIMDMCLLAKLDATIATTGTYSWWAAALCAGTTTYQSEFARANSPIMVEYKRDEHFPPKWVPL